MRVFCGERGKEPGCGDMDVAVFGRELGAGDAWGESERDGALEPGVVSGRSVGDTFIFQDSQGFPFMIQ